MKSHTELREEIQQELNAMTVKELRKMAKDVHTIEAADMSGYSRMVKADLIDRLTSDQAMAAVELKLFAASLGSSTPAPEPTPEPQPFPDEVVIQRDSPGSALITATFGGSVVAGLMNREGDRWAIGYGLESFRAGSLQKAAKKFAKRLGFHAENISITHLF